MRTGSKELVDAAQVEEARPTAVERCQRELKERRNRLEQMKTLFAYGAEDQLRMMIDTIPTLVWSCRPDGDGLYVNEFLLEYTGLGLDEFHATDLRARILRPDDVERLRDESQKALACGTLLQLDQRARGKAGRGRWSLLHKAAVAAGTLHLPPPNRSGAKPNRLHLLFC